MSDVSLVAVALLQMAACLQEVLYCTSDSADRAISESLYFIRGEEEIEDEEDIGGLQRPWLSQFEFIKVFSASPALNFLSWLELWYFLPSIEKGLYFKYSRNFAFLFNGSFSSSCSPCQVQCVWSEEHNWFQISVHQVPQLYHV